MCPPLKRFCCIVLLVPPTLEDILPPMSSIHQQHCFTGRAIYIDKRKGGSTACFFELDNVLKNSQANTQVVFEGNHAEIAGNALYGGQVYLCAMLNTYKVLQDWEEG